MVNRIHESNGHHAPEHHTAAYYNILSISTPSDSMFAVYSDEEGELHYLPIAVLALSEVRRANWSGADIQFGEGREIVAMYLSHDGEFMPANFLEGYKGIVYDLSDMDKWREEEEDDS